MNKRRIPWFPLILSGFVFISYNNCQPIGETYQKGFDVAPSTDGGGGGSGGGGSDTDPGSTPENEAFFNTNVKALFETSCNSCHAEPRFVDDPAPLSIFSYASMRTMVVDGPSSSNNTLINKMQGILAHDGGNRCPGGVTAEPCLSVSAWRNKELPASANGIAGAITYVSERGRVTGWAQDPANAALTVTVHLYADNGVDGGGTLIGTVVADDTGLGAYNGHYFTFDLPAAYANNVTRMLYVYAGATAEADSLLPGSPLAYAAYTPTQEGMDYYADTVQGQLNACAACHIVDYNTQYNSLLQPSPFKGGTAATNQLVVKASGGAAHGGGSFCNNVNQGLCADLQTWWELEFE